MTGHKSGGDDKLTQQLASGVKVTIDFSGADLDISTHGKMVALFARYVSKLQGIENGGHRIIAPSYLLRDGRGDCSFASDAFPAPGTRVLRKSERPSGGDQPSSELVI